MVIGSLPLHELLLVLYFYFNFFGVSYAFSCLVDVVCDWFSLFWKIWLCFSKLIYKILVADSELGRICNLRRDYTLWNFLWFFIFVDVVCDWFSLLWKIWISLFHLEPWKRLYELLIEVAYNFILSSFQHISSCVQIWKLPLCHMQG